MKEIRLTKISTYSALGFIAILIILHLLKPEIDPNWQPISEYALGDWGFLMNIAFCLLGIAMLTLGIALIYAIKTIGAKLGGALIILGALGNFLATFFNTDPVITPPENMTTTGQIHAGAAGLLGFMVLGTLFILYQFFKQPRLAQFKTKILAATVVVWVFEIIAIISGVIYFQETEGILSPDTPIGWQGRLVIVATAIWIIVCSNSLKEVFRTPNFKDIK